MSSIPTQSDDLRDEIADVLAEYDRSRKSPTGDAVEIEIRASDRLVNYIQANYTPKPTDTNVASLSFQEAMNKHAKDMADWNKPKTAPAGFDINKLKNSASSQEFSQTAKLAPAVQGDDWMDEIASQLANYWLDNKMHDWRLGYERLFNQAKATVETAIQAQLDAARKEWESMLDRAVDGEVVKLNRNNVDLTISTMEGHRDGMSRVVDSAMHLGQELERIKKSKAPKELATKLFTQADVDAAYQRGREEAGQEENELWTTVLNKFQKALEDNKPMSNAGLAAIDQIRKLYRYEREEAKRHG